MVPEKRKVFRTLAGSKAKVVSPKPQAPRHIKDCAPSVTRVSEALHVAPATPVADAWVVPVEIGKVIGEKSKSQNLNQLNAA